MFLTFGVTTLKLEMREIKGKEISCRLKYNEESFGPFKRISHNRLNYKLKKYQGGAKAAFYDDEKRRLVWSK